MLRSYSSMTKGLIQKIAVLVFFTAVCGLLVLRRFDSFPQEDVRIIASQNSDYQIGDWLRRGETIETKDGEYLLMTVGQDVTVGIDQRSRVELSRIFKDERTLIFPRGRIVVIDKSSTPVFVETNKTVSVLDSGETVFINYDFEKLITVAPVRGSVQTHIKGEQDYLLVPVPLNIKESDPVLFSKTTLDQTKGPSAPFHHWMNQQLH